VEVAITAFLNIPLDEQADVLALLMVRLRTYNDSASSNTCEALNFTTTLAYR